MLNCTWPKHLIGTDEITNNGFNMGVFLMATGMGEITDKTIPELKFRSELLARLHGDGFYREVDLELWKGLTINASNDSRRKWLAAKKKGMLSSKPTKKQAEARFNLYVAQSEVETCC